MQSTLYLKLVGCVSEQGFSLDELVMRTKELFASEGMAGVVGLILSLVDERLSVNLVAGRQGWRPKPCCDRCKYEHCRRSNRRFRTSIGTVHIHWRVLRCSACGRSVVPLREFLQVERYQSKAAELERIVAEVVSEQSYRRSSDHLQLIGEVPVPKSTAHRWVAQSSCDEISTQDKSVDIIIGDGTGYKRRPDQIRRIDNHGEIRIVLGITPRGTVLPFGAWSGNSWNEISEAIMPGSADEKPLAKVLVSDGEPQLAECLARLANSAQRCHWHMVHQLDYKMWKDGAAKDDRRQMQKLLAGTIGIELPAEDVETVSEIDKLELEIRARDAQEEIEKLIRQFRVRGYKKAAEYIDNAKSKLFTYIHFWLSCGLVSPRASSMIERIMREIGRRLKRIAFGWSEAGAAKMARIIIKRITSAGEWDSYWQRRLRLDGNVILLYGGVRAEPTTLGR